MSTTTASDFVTELSSPKLDETENVAADLPVDPLLESGAFIDVNSETLGNGENQTAEPQIEDKSPNDEPEAVDTSKVTNGADPMDTSKVTNGADPVTPASENIGSPSDPKPRRRMVPTDSWLPAGWTVLDRVRTSGLTAGTVDKYYIDPTGRRFRSKIEVLHFVEHGEKPSSKRKNTDTPESSDGGKKQKSSVRKIKAAKAAVNFDYENAPEKINWVLTDTTEDLWSPFVGDKKVAQAKSREWSAVFTSMTSRNGGQKLF